MKDWYERYYTAIEYSASYAEFCSRVFGRNYAQHGFADMDQVARLVDALDIRSTDSLLDLGCGTGGMVAHVGREFEVEAFGLDYDQRAMALAGRKYAADRVHFVAGDIGALCFAAASFEIVIAIDTLYFTRLEPTVAALVDILAYDGRAGILYSHGADPQNPLPHFDRSTLPPERTPLGVVLASRGLPYMALDLTEEDRRHALKKKSVLEDLKDDFIAEGNEFLFENRYGEACGVLAAIEANAHARYQYIITKPGGNHVAPARCTSM